MPVQAHAMRGLLPYEQEGAYHIGGFLTGNVNTKDTLFSVIKILHFATAKCNIGCSVMLLAERVGFEPTVPCGITGFQDQLLKPLGHLSLFKFDVGIITDPKAGVNARTFCRPTSIVMRPLLQSHLQVI